MPRTKRPVADPAEDAFVRTEDDRVNCAPSDLRQLSHELRTPLNAVLGNTELLLDGSCGPLSAQARACLGEIQTAGRDLLRHVRLLLAWSELCVGRPGLSECPVDMVALVREASTSHGRSAVLVDPQDARLIVRGDRSRLRMLVVEIIGLNAPVEAVNLESRAGGSALRFAWSGFCAARTGALQIALIEAIARLKVLTWFCIQTGCLCFGERRRIGWARSHRPTTRADRFGGEPSGLGTAHGRPRRRHTFLSGVNKQPRGLSCRVNVPIVITSIRLTRNPRSAAAFVLAGRKHDPRPTRGMPGGRA